jgi:hypothetical protein
MTCPSADEDIAVRAGDDVGRLEQLLAVRSAGALLAGNAEGQQQFAVAVVLEHLMPYAPAALRVGDPDAALIVDVQAMRKNVGAGAPALEQLPDGSNFRMGGSGRPAQLFSKQR